MEAQPKITNLTEMSQNRAILTMALPATAMMLVQSLYYLVDTYWIGKLGASPMAAVSATSFLIWMIFSFGDISGVAANALAARAVGEKRYRQVSEYLRQCLLVSLITGLTVTLVLLPLHAYIFTWLNLEQDVVIYAGQYLLPWLYLLPAMLFSVTIGAFFRGVGDTRTPLLLMIMLVILNAILDPIFIFGFGPVPAMGLSGAAWVTVVNHLAYVIVGAWILYRRGLWPAWSGLGYFMVAAKDLSQIFRIGSPIAMNGVLFSLTYIGLTWVISHSGSPAVAAIGIGHRIEAFPWFVCYGFSVAAASLVGQYLGAGRPMDAESAVWKCVGIAGVFVLLFAILMVFWVEPIVRFFIDDPVVVAEAAVYLRIVSVAWLAGLFEVVLEGAFSGSGNTLPAMVIGVPMTVIRIPLAYVLAMTLEMGALGVWLSIGLTMLIKGVLITFWFTRRRWMKSRVH